MESRDFWKRFDEIRKKITIKEICEKTGILFGSFMRIRADKRLPNLSDAYKIASYLGVSLDYLLTGEQPDNDLTAKEKEIIRLYRNTDFTTQLLIEQAMRNNQYVKKTVEKENNLFSTVYMSNR